MELLITEFYFAFIILHLLKKGNRILEHSIFVKIGKVSYGMYIYHMLALTFLKYIGFDVLEFTPLMFVVFFLSSYFISFLSYKYLESYFLNFKERVNF